MCSLALQGGSWDGVVSMAARGSNPSTGKIFFFFSKMSHLVLGPNQLPIQLVLQFPPKGTA